MSSVRPLVYTNTTEYASENGDFSGDIENGAREYARVNNENRYTLLMQAYVRVVTQP